MPIIRRPSPDRSKIAMDDRFETKYWTRHFGITFKDLARVVGKVGNSAAAVQKQLEMEKATVRER
jgi:hypothetical protein